MRNKRFKDLREAFEACLVQEIDVHLLMPVAKPEAQISGPLGVVG